MCREGLKNETIKRLGFWYNSPSFVLFLSLVILPTAFTWSQARWEQKKNDRRKICNRTPNLREKNKPRPQVKKIQQHTGEIYVPQDPRGMFSFSSEKKKSEHEVKKINIEK